MKRQVGDSNCSVSSHHAAHVATRPVLRGRGVSSRLLGAVAAAAITFGLIQSIAVSFQSVPETQLAKATAGKVILANAR